MSRMRGVDQLHTPRSTIIWHMYLRDGAERRRHVTPLVGVAHAGPRLMCAALVSHSPILSLLCLTACAKRETRPGASPRSHIGGMWEMINQCHER